MGTPDHGRWPHAEEQGLATSRLGAVGRGNETSAGGFPLRGGTRHTGLLAGTVLLVYMAAIPGNSVLVLLCADPQLHSPTYVLLSQLSLTALPSSP
ncbi:Olfactory receptor 2AE1 [Tupaia chinensis]|uniref:Olfactory receptor 2AE1 n=1 Tax=Tupaia chinensis TaxID=246437 RepID=L9KWH2_TUPCH|nr:Olfactory receptor 2AE1 [Tupaia chinensis]